MDPSHEDRPPVRIEAVTSANWRDVARLRVAPGQEAYVADPAYYLALCCYDQAGWSPLAVVLEGAVVGFLMWAVDPDDGACWLGGVTVDARRQGEGIGTAAVRAVLTLLTGERGFGRFALSYEPSNARAKRVYARIGFTETGEREGDEVVARLER